jgi:hypothetical protein
MEEENISVPPINPTEHIISSNDKELLQNLSSFIIYL